MPPKATPLAIKYKLSAGAVAPAYKSAGAAGADLAYDGRHGAIAVRPGLVSCIPTGVSIELPPGYEAQVRARSGLAADGFFIVNGVGTVDEDFRGEIVVLMSSVQHVRRFVKGDRIAQLVIAPVARVAWESSDALGETERGAKGFGSTGVA